MPSIIAGGVVAAAAAGSAASGIMGASAAKSAGDKAAYAARQAAQLNMDTYGTTRSDLMPYIESGYKSLPALEAYPGMAQNALLGAYGEAKSHIPGDMTIESLEKTPFYQFARDQGLKALQSNAASRGLGFSGQSMQKGMEYASGLAQKNYETAFDIQNKQYQDYLSQLNALTGITKQGYDQYSGNVNIGATAAARSGQFATEAAKEAGGQLTGAGKAQAAGITGQANALGGMAKELGQLPGAYFGAVDYFTPSAAPGTSGGYNAGNDLISPTTGQVTVPPIPPA